MLPGTADPAVDLDVLPGALEGRVASQLSRCQRCKGELLGLVIRTPGCRLRQSEPPRPSVKVCDQVLDGLEGADDRAELSARFGVLKAGVQTRLRNPELFIDQDHLSSLLSEGKGRCACSQRRSLRWGPPVVSTGQAGSLPALIEPVLYGPFKGIGVEQEDERLTALIVLSARSDRRCRRGGHGPKRRSRCHPQSDRPDATVAQVSPIAQAPRCCALSASASLMLRRSRRHGVGEVEEASSARPSFAEVAHRLKAICVPPYASSMRRLHKPSSAHWFQARLDSRQLRLRLKEHRLTAAGSSQRSVSASSSSTSGAGQKSSGCQSSRDLRTDRA